MMMTFPRIQDTKTSIVVYNVNYYVILSIFLYTFFTSHYIIVKNTLMIKKTNLEELWKMQRRISPISDGQTVFKM